MNLFAGNAIIRLSQELNKLYIIEFRGCLKVLFNRRVRKVGAEDAKLK